MRLRGLTGRGAEPPIDAQGLHKFAKEAEEALKNTEDTDLDLFWLDVLWEEKTPFKQGGCLFKLMDLARWVGLWGRQDLVGGTRRWVDGPCAQLAGWWEGAPAGRWLPVTA